MDLVHRLHWIIEKQPWQALRDGEVEGEKKGERSSVQVARAQHRRRRTTGLAVTVNSVQLRFDPPTPIRNLEGGHERLLGCESHEEIPPSPIEVVIEDTSHHPTAGGLGTVVHAAQNGATALKLGGGLLRLS